MPYYVIGSDKGLEEAYTADQIDNQMQQVNNNISTANNNISTIQTNLNTANANINGKQPKIKFGTNAPTGGNNGDVYIQY